MAVLSVAKADNDVSITIMKMGEAVYVSATRSSIITKDGEPDQAADSGPANDNKPDADQPVEMGDSHGAGLRPARPG